MKNSIYSLLLLSSTLLATNEVDSIDKMFHEGTASGNIKYYYIQTDKDFATKTSTSAYANSLGGQLHYETAKFKGFQTNVTFMSTNPFLLPDSVDSSIIGKDNGARGLNASKGFSILGEANINYTWSNLSFLVGRQAIKTPLVNAKVVRMLPSTVQGAFSSYKAENVELGVAYIDKFKQRTSSDFMNIVEHALGSNTEAVTGHKNGYIVMGDIKYRSDLFTLNFYDYYAADFLNSIYGDINYKEEIMGATIGASLQYINQVSVGNASTNLDKDGSVTGGKVINSNAFGAKAFASHKGATITVAYSKVLKSDSEHDALVLPWDGTPLFTNMITANNLFESIYGSALKADSVYIGDSQGIKVAYSQKLDMLGAAGLTSTLAFLNTSNSRFPKSQQDYNAVLAYKYDKSTSIALKGIWVPNSAGMSADGTITQIEKLSQYRVIANYKF